MKLSEELQARGFIYQTSIEDIGEILDGEKRTVYLGIDPTADSIHVGNLVPYMLLNRLSQAGHKVILLMGGGTALIGDPGGKSEERPFVEPEVIAGQAKKMEEGIRRFVSDDVQFVNNFDWLSQLSMIEFLRDVGKHFTVNSMIKKDIVANRLTDDNSISYTEFSYSLLQSFDYYHLNQEFGCDLQIGGSDQWSNIVAGVDFIRRKTGNQVYALTMPLVTDKATGKKFGKSEGNAIWLDPEKTSPYAFYQFWLNTSDENVIDYLKLFTYISLEEIAEVEREHQANPGARGAQRLLADKVTSFVHSEAKTEQVKKAAAALFGGVNFKDLSDDEITILKESTPTINLQSGTNLIDALVEGDLAASKREARTFIESEAVQINNEKVTDLETVLDSALYSNQLLLQRGKKKHLMIELT